VVAVATETRSRGRTIVRRLVAATTLVLCLGLAPSAHAAAPREFYGVISADDPTQSQINRMGAGHVGTLRINLVWGAVQPNQNDPLDWSHYDELIGAAARNGIHVLPTVYSSPKWAAALPNYPPDDQFRPDFRAFVRAAAERYGSNGAFWMQNPQIPKLPITDWQLWNEPNSPSFWFSKPSPRQYAALLRVFHDGIKGGDPSARIVLAGLFRTPRIHNGIFLSKYLPAIYRAGARDLFDAVAVHPYATTPKIALEALKETRTIMRRFKDKKKPLWITELGWATGGQPTPLTVSLQRQANYLRQSFKLLAANRGRLHIAGVVWYSFMDEPGPIWVGHTGLFTESGDPKPSWNAFVNLTGGTP
jgi:polysaccharide biosynthesis protein PslG